MTSSQTAPRKPEPRDPQESRELARVVALLRALPDPEPPQDLAARVMAEVRRREARPRILRVAFRATRRSGVVAALAAGFACLAVFATLRDAAPGREEGVRRKLVPSVARPIDLAGSPMAASDEVSAPLLADPVSLLAYDVPEVVFPRFDSAVVEVNSALTRRLDHQLNRLLLNPDRFYRQLERHANRDVAIARLADRAAERGDAISVALWLRETAPGDPNTARFIEKLFGAVLERSIPRR